MSSANPYQPQQFSTKAATSGQRPIAATIFGILNLVFGIFGLCGGAVGLVGIAMMASMGEEIEMGPVNPLRDPVFFGFSIINAIVSLVLTTILIASGVGLLQFKPWGRKLANVYAIPALVMIVVGLVVQIVFTIIPSAQMLEDVDGPARGALIGGIVGGIAGLCFAPIYPICLLVFMNRRSFREAIDPPR